jgi:hypothetical protein
MYTNITEFLDTSRKMASYFLSRMPKDGITPWQVPSHSVVFNYFGLTTSTRDFDAIADSNRPADSSAAMTASTGFLFLSQIESWYHNHTGAKYWSDAAIKV